MTIIGYKSLGPRTLREDFRSRTEVPGSGNPLGDETYEESDLRLRNEIMRQVAQMYPLSREQEVVGTGERSHSRSRAIVIHTD